MKINETTKSDNIFPLPKRPASMSDKDWNEFLVWNNKMNDELKGYAKRAQSNLTKELSNIKL